MDVNIFHEKLVQAVKDVGQDIIDNAEGYVGSANMLSDMTITVRFNPDFSMLVPTIEVEKNYLCKKAAERIKFCDETNEILKDFNEMKKLNEEGEETERAFQSLRANEKYKPTYVSWSEKEKNDA